MLDIELLKKSLQFKNRKARIYTHNDLDGLASAILVKKWLIQNGLKELDKVIVLTYQRKFPMYSLDQRYFNILLDFAETAPGFDLYIDHHEQSEETASIINRNRGKYLQMKAPSAARLVANYLNVKVDGETLVAIDAVDSGEDRILPGIDLHKLIFLEKDATSKYAKIYLARRINRLLSSDYKLLPYGECEKIDCYYDNEKIVALIDSYDDLDLEGIDESLNILSPTALNSFREKTKEVIAYLKDKYIRLLNKPIKLDILDYRMPIGGYQKILPSLNKTDVVIVRHSSMIQVFNVLLRDRGKCNLQEIGKRIKDFFEKNVKYFELEVSGHSTILNVSNIPNNNISIKTRMLPGYVRDNLNIVYDKIKTYYKRRSLNNPREFSLEDLKFNKADLIIFTFVYFYFINNF